MQNYLSLIYVSDILVQVCAEIRRLYPESLPIIMISANHDESSILEGLNVSKLESAVWDVFL